MSYCILSLDGGGIRGLYTSVLLNRILAGFPELLSRTQLIAGTSTGGIIALGLASGLQPRDLIDLYEADGSAIFQTNWLRRLTRLFGLIGTDYSNANLRRMLDQKLGAKRLNDLNKKVLIPAFDLDNAQDTPPGSPPTWKPKFFHNFPGPDSDGAELAVDVALRTSAAPIYFPEYQHYVDGGVVANNPSMAAVAQAIDSGTGMQQLENIRLFSLGTGTRLTHIGGQNHAWGLVHWARPLVSIMIEGVMGVADYQCRRLLGETRYFRLAPNLKRDVAIDDVSSIPQLIKDANSVDINPALSWLKTNF